MLEATCHCGAVRLQVESAPTEVTSCNCSICRRLGTLWAYYDWKQITLIPATGATQAYAWGDKSISFNRCTVCGCTTHWSPNDGTTRLGINARLLDAKVLAAARVRLLDGADTWKFLDEPASTT